MKYAKVLTAVAIVVIFVLLVGLPTSCIDLTDRLDAEARRQM